MTLLSLGYTSGNRLRCALLLTSCVLVALFVSANGCSSSDKSPALRIVFIGNSYTSVNDLPHMLRELARSGGHEIEAGMSAVGGWTLADHARSPETLQRLDKSGFDVVVLQEQSQIPADDRSRNATMFPAVRTLVQHIRSANARPMLYLTWGHHNGWPENHIDGYEEMQTKITEGYLEIANELGIQVGPVGEAWRRATGGLTPLELWQPDGSHPTEQGTYLAACVFYASLFHESPEGLSYVANVPEVTAHTLQSIARLTVLSDGKHWHLQ